jgi:hypothetical protein
MNKKLIFGLTLAVVLVSGALISAQAECLGCLPHVGQQSCMGCQSQPGRDLDRSDATCQGALRFGPTAPEFMGSVTVGGA